jgi:hypothetical protein
MEQITYHLRLEGGLSPSPRKVYTKKDRVPTIRSKRFKLGVPKVDSRRQIRHHTKSKNAIKRRAN